MAVNPYANESNLPFIIGEIGINHNGDVEIAKKIIDMAKECGIDAVKFQKRTIDIVYDKNFLKSPRQSPWGSTQGDQKKGLEFGKKEYDEIDDYCKEKDIYWFSSAWDEKSQIFFRRYNLPFNKVASAMLTHKNLLDIIANERKHTFISTGMSNYKQIDRAVKIFKKHKCPYTIMHCVSLYPCPDEWCNTKMVETLKKKYNCSVGYSGHEAGILPSLLAVALGAVAIERHITLDRSMYGSDQSASLEKRGLELLARDAKTIGKMLGSEEKNVIPEEEKIAYKLRYFKETDFEWHEE